MTDHQDNGPGPQPPAGEIRPARFAELAELEEKIQRRLRSNQRFLERFMDEDFDDLDDEDAGGDEGEDDLDQMEEL